MRAINKAKARRSKRSDARLAMVDASRFACDIEMREAAKSLLYAVLWMVLLLQKFKSTTILYPKEWDEQRSMPSAAHISPTRKDVGYLK